MSPLSPSVTPPVGAAHVPSARKKLVVPPPEAGTTPGEVTLKVFAVSDIVPLVVIGPPETVIAEFAEDTSTEVTDPVPDTVAHETLVPSVVKNRPALPT